MASSKIFLVLIFSSFFGWDMAQKYVCIPANYCAAFLSYDYDTNGYIMGNVTLPNNGDGYIDFEVHFSFTTNATLPNNLSVKLERMEQDLGDCQPINYHLHFPYTNLIPMVTLIRLNGVELCSSPEGLVPLGKKVWTFGAAHSYWTNNKFDCGKSQNEGTDEGYSPSPPRSQPATPRGDDNNQCGISKGSNFVSRQSLGGDDVQGGEFPWMGALMYRNDANAISIACTVTLINLKYVVTQGHCIDQNGSVELDKEDLMVVLGITDTKHIVHGVSRNVSNIYIRPGIKPNTASNDVALIQMNRRVGYITDRVVPICLWTGDKDLANLIALNPGTLVGWGDTFRTSKRLNKIYVPVISHQTCVDSSSFPDGFVDVKTFCGGLGDGMTGTCRTDAGASFNVQKDRGGPWFLRGILSVTPANEGGNCNLNGYSLYVDLADHYQWMYNIISRDGF